jgi:hypothetical protein
MGERRKGRKNYREGEVRYEVKPRIIERKRETGKQEGGKGRKDREKRQHRESEKRRK